MCSTNCTRLLHVLSLSCSTYQSYFVVQFRWRDLLPFEGDATRMRPQMCSGESNKHSGGVVQIVMCIYTKQVDLYASSSTAPTHAAPITANAEVGDAVGPDNAVTRRVTAERER